MDSKPEDGTNPNYRNIKETYKIEGTIGRGSFATVKKAKFRATG